MQEEDKPRYKKILLKIWKIFLLILGFLWVVQQVVSVIDFAAVVDFATELSGVDPEIYLSSQPSDLSIEPITTILDTDFFKVYTLISTVFAVVGTFVITRRRSLYAALGLFVAFIIPRERRHWGRVKDRESRQSIPFARVMLVSQRLNGETKILKETVTDVDGKYRLFISGGSKDHKLRVVANNYQQVDLPIATIARKGELIEVTDDILLDSKGETSIISRSRVKPRVYRYMMWLTYLFSIIYLVIFYYYFLAFPDSLYGAIVGVMFTISVVRNTQVMKERFFRPKGRILEKETKDPIPNVHANLLAGKGVRDTKTTDDRGLVSFNAEAGTYKLQAYKDGYEVASVVDQGGVLDVEVDASGFLKENIYLWRTEVSVATSDGGDASFLNPFKD